MLHDTKDLFNVKGYNVSIFLYDRGQRNNKRKQGWWYGGHNSRHREKTADKRQQDHRNPVQHENALYESKSTAWLTVLSPSIKLPKLPPKSFLLWYFLVSLDTDWWFCCFVSDRRNFLIRSILIAQYVNLKESSRCMYHSFLSIRIFLRTSCAIVCCLIILVIL